MLGQYLTVPSGETAMQDGVWVSLAAKTLTWDTRIIGVHQLQMSLLVPDIGLLRS